MSKALAEKYLKKYILNYKDNTFSLKLLKGRVSFKNLILNAQAVNADLDLLNLPLTLNLGLIKQLTIDVSILKACLEEIVIDELVLVLSPDPSKADRDFDLNNEERLNLLEELIGKYKKYAAWRSELEELFEALRSNEGNKEQLQKKIRKKILKFSLKKSKAGSKSLYKSIDLEEPSHYEAFYESGEPKYQTKEEKVEWYEWLYDQIKLNLSAKIEIKKIKIYYQYKPMASGNKYHSYSGIDSSSHRDHMILSLECDSLTLEQTDDIKGHLNKDGWFRRLANLNTIEQQMKVPVNFDLFKIESSKITLSLCCTSTDIVPKKFKDTMSLMNAKGQSSEKVKLRQLDAVTFIQEFLASLGGIRESQYTLVSITQLALELLLGKRKENTGKPKNQRLYDVYLLNCNLGNYDLSIELDNLNLLVEMTTYYLDTIMLSDSSSFRPFLKPITQQDVTSIKARMKTRFGLEEEKALEVLKKHVTKDYMRLMLYVSLLRKYGSLSNVDTKRRIIWTFKKSSLIYQLITGKTLRDIILEENEFLRKETKYLEKSCAIEFNDRLINFELFSLEPGEDDFENYLRQLVNLAKNHLSNYQMNVSISFSCRLSLFELDTKQSSLKSRQMIKQLEVSIDKIEGVAKKPLGEFSIEAGLEVGEVMVQFLNRHSEDGEEETPLKFNEVNIEDLLGSNTYSMYFLLI